MKITGIIDFYAPETIPSVSRSFKVIRGHLRSFLTVFGSISFWSIFGLFLGLKTGKNWKNDIFFDFFLHSGQKIEKSYVKISNVHQLFKNNFLGFWPIDGANWVKMRSNSQIRMRLIPLNPKHSKTPIYLKNSTRYCDLSNVKYDILTFKI